MSTEFMMFKKVLALPTVPCDPNTIYLVSTANPDMFKILVSNKTGTVLKDVTGTDYIKSMVVGVLNSTDSGVDWQDIHLKSNGGYVWSALNEKVHTHSSTNSPEFGVVKGNMHGVLFPASSVSQSWVNFTLPYDIYEGGNIYLGTNCMGITASEGTVKIGLEYQIVKGFGQELLGNTNTVYLSHALSSSDQYRPHSLIVPDNDSISSNSIEPGTHLKVRVFRDPFDNEDTYTESIHLWEVSLHYQRARPGTRNKKPNFFT